MKPFTSLLSPILSFRADLVFLSRAGAFNTHLIFSLFSSFFKRRFFQELKAGAVEYTDCISAEG